MNEGALIHIGHILLRAVLPVHPNEHRKQAGVGSVACTVEVTGRRHWMWNWHSCNLGAVIARQFAPVQVNETNLLASRHYAAEGRCFVIAVGALLRRRDLALADSSVLPEDPDALLLDGATTIIGICTPNLLHLTCNVLHAYHSSAFRVPCTYCVLVP